MKIQEQAEQLAQQFTDRIVPEGQRRVLHDLSADEYPDIFVAFIKTQARKLFDKNSPLQFSPGQRYLLEMQEMAEQIAAIKEQMIQATIFDRHEIYAVAQHAFRMQLEMLVKPRIALIRWLYRKRPTEMKQKQAVLTVLQGFDCRRRLIDEWLEKIKATASDSLEQEDLERLCRTVEKQLFQQRPVSTILSEVNAYIEFESAVLGRPGDRVDSEMLLLLLREREIEQICEMFSVEAEEKPLWSLADIENALGRFLLIGNIEVDVGVAGTVNPLRRREAHPSRARRMSSGTRAELEKRQFSFFDRREDREPSEQPVTEPADRDDISEQGAPDVRKFERYADQKLRLTEEDRVLVNSLFERDENQYVEFMDNVKRAPNWDTAKAAIEKEMSARKVSPYSKEALQLGDIIFIRYFTSD